jgi:Tripartite tricarboxylate transporter family receptor
LIGQWLSERLGQQFFIENRPDASGNIAAEAVVRSPPDGYTLLVTNDANAYSATLYDNLKFNFIHDITPVASIWRVGFVMVVNPSFAAKTVPELMSDLSPKGDPKRTSLHHAQAPAVLDHLRTPPQGDGDAGPTLAGGAVGGERNMIVLDASDVLDDAFAVRRPCVDAKGEVSSRHGHLWWNLCAGSQNENPARFNGRGSREPSSLWRGQGGTGFHLANAWSGQRFLYLNVLCTAYTAHPEP